MVLPPLDPSKGARGSEMSSIASSVFSESCYNRMSRKFASKIRPPNNTDGKARNEQVDFVDDQSVDSEVKASRIQKQSLEKEVSSLKHHLFNSGGIVTLDQLLEAEGKLKDITEENEILESICRENKERIEKEELTIETSLPTRKSDSLLNRVLALDFDKESDEESLCNAKKFYFKCKYLEHTSRGSKYTLAHYLGLCVSR